MQTLNSVFKILILKNNLLLLSIIIVNFNVKFFLEQCLHSVQNAVLTIEAEIIVIDNNSNDGSKEFFIDKFPKVQFVWNNDNIGFSKANNIGLDQAKGKFILFLNPDTIVAEDCFKKCLTFFEMHQNIGALGVRMIDGGGKFLKESKRGFPSLFPSVFKLFALAAIFPNSKVFARYYLGNLSQYENHPVDVLSGAFMLIEKNVLDKIGAFDEDFFMYGEDIDLSYRIQNAGFKNYYFAESTIIHFKGESTKKGNLKYVQLFYGAMNLFLKKHNTSLKSTLYNFFINIAIGLKIANNNIKNIVSVIGNKNSESSNYPLTTVVIATKSNYDTIINGLVNNVIKLRIIGRVRCGQSDTSSSIGNLNDLSAIIKKHTVDKIIFCINDISIVNTLAIIQTLHPSVNYFFHFAGSNSIVGSIDKNEEGDCIELNKNQVLSKL